MRVRNHSVREDKMIATSNSDPINGSVDAEPLHDAAWGHPRAASASILRSNAVAITDSEASLEHSRQFT